VSQWNGDKNVKPDEMKAIVRKRQQRRLVDKDKGELHFRVRGSLVNLKKIERWMRRNEVPDDKIYVPNPAACKELLIILSSTVLAKMTSYACGPKCLDCLSSSEPWCLNAFSCVR
jgi:hypothetical protein